jgi:magnesium-transporting ATPase (P-type)
MVFRSIDETVKFPVSLNETSFESNKIQGYDLCATGPAVTRLEGTKLFDKLISRIWIYARVSPTHKVANVYLFY